MSVRKDIGKSEWKVMGFILDHHPASVREVAAQMAETHGLARTSVLTVMERLREKGHLKRRRKGGVWVYSPQLNKDDLLRLTVKDFVETRLQGKLSPFVAYLTEEVEANDEQINELRDLVASLERKTKQNKGQKR